MIILLILKFIIDYFKISYKYVLMITSRMYNINYYLISLMIQQHFKQIQYPLIIHVILLY